MKYFIFVNDLWPMPDGHKNKYNNMIISWSKIVVAKNCLIKIN